jgi:hypothetical protein
MAYTKWLIKETNIKSLKIILSQPFTDEYALAKNYSVAELIYRSNEHEDAMIEKIIFKKR